MPKNLRGILPLTVVALIFTFTSAARAQYTETVIYNFADTPDGVGPEGDVTLDSAGNLYGTTFGGGANNYGAVYELSPTSSGWSESILYSFNNTSGGGYPGSGVTSDGAGNFFGTTTGGGTGHNGVAFELSPASGGGWTESVLYNFQGGTDGGLPANLVIGGDGVLYGTTYLGGAHSLGTVFKLTPSSGGTWTETVIHSFTGGADGSNPTGSLTVDATGNIYGTTTTGANTTTTICAGLGGCGTVFRMTPGTHWQFTTLFTFQGSRGAGPMGHLAFDAAGNIYGGTLAGGSCRQLSTGCGTVFRLTPSAQGWKETVLHLFTNDYDGRAPASGLIFDPAGNLFGTASAGGPPLLLCGTAFELTPVSGTWDFTVLTQFANGCFPSSGLTLDSSGNLYGGTGNGGTEDYGTVFELSPTAATSAR